MAAIALFHSVRGLQALEREAAERLRAAGHSVSVPDLFDGETAPGIEEGMALAERVGWERAAPRAEAAIAALPADAVLAGISYGAGIASHLWARRPEATAILFLHGPGEIPDSARRETPLQVHIAEPDPWEDEDFLASWLADAAGRVALEAHRYAGAGHLFTDRTLPDHDADAAALLWRRVDAFLSRL